MEQGLYDSAHYSMRGTLLPSLLSLSFSGSLFFSQLALIRRSHMKEERGKKESFSDHLIGCSPYREMNHWPRTQLCFNAQ